MKKVENVDPVESHTAAKVCIDDVRVVFGRGKSAHTALDGVSFDLFHGETVGLVGESGCGKSTLAKVLTSSIRPNSGRITIDGLNPVNLRRRERFEHRRSLQLIPQDPYSSLNPRATVGYAIAEALAPRRPSLKLNLDRVEELLDLVKLPRGTSAKYPHELSGGQRQRVAIARALAIEPEVIIADEITSALDVSVQAEILQLLEGLRSSLSITMLFISHNMAVVSQVCDRVAVLFQGRLVEIGSTADVFDSPADPYTRKLLESVPGAPGFSLDRNERN
ncbi:ABC-type glutathione transport system ATPase component [Rhodococcus sp. 27YEA15]|uniref:ABC transporter ATP-binding protein n=1 Tax=Rhodococcus sp. 27YEA15 TaxID=3156259 RepID=UPI003C7B05A8